MVEEEPTPMANEDYTSALLATLAQETARKVGCQAVRWWQDTYNPRRLYIEVHYTLSDGHPFPVWISTPVPGYLADTRQAKCQAAPREPAARLRVTKSPRECPGFVTATAQPTPAPQRLSRS